jgi:hypothetical protein
MSSIAMQNSFFGAVPHGERRLLLDLERSLQQDARIQHYNDASTASKHIIESPCFPPDASAPEWCQAFPSYVYGRFAMILADFPPFPLPVEKPVALKAWGLDDNDA